MQFSILFVSVCDGGTYYIEEKLKLSLYIIFAFYFKKLFWINVLELGQLTSENCIVLLNNVSLLEISGAVMY